MNDSSDNRPVRPDLIARKIECARNFEHEDVLSEMMAEPRLNEVLWFLEWVSRGGNYPGGLRKFTRDLIAESRDLLGNEAMQMYAEAPNYTARALEEIAAEWPIQHDIFSEETPRFSHSKAELLRKCESAANEKLAAYLRALCEGTAVTFRRGLGELCNDVSAPWYFARVADAILRFMDRRKDVIAGEIAETAVSREIFRRLGMAVRSRDSIIIEGNSRFGKTEAIRAWCRMYPGRARLVETPDSNSLGDLLLAVAKALGLSVGPKQPGQYLRPMIEYVLQHSGLALIFEEAHFLYPSKLSKNTAPARMNWVRRSLMDAGVPVALICTPQSYQQAQRRFVKATGYAIEQLEGRFLPTIKLPLTVSDEDLLAIARKHLPGVPDFHIGYVVELVAATERNYCSDVRSIGRLSFINAEDSGRKIPNLADIKAAIAEALPQPASEPATPPKMPLQTPRKQLAELPPGPVRVRSSEPSTFECTDRTESLSILPG